MKISHLVMTLFTLSALHLQTTPIEMYSKIETRGSQINKLDPPIYKLYPPE